jgi:CHAT domain-containing protein/Flp pilus assembly protein TadD
MVSLRKAFDKRRPIEPRLSGGFKGAPFDPATGPSLNVNQKDMDEATILLTDAVAKGEPGSRLGYARLKLCKGENADAQQQLRRQLADAPEDAAALNDLGVCFIQQSKLEDAIDQFDLALERRPGMREALFNRGLCYERMSLQEPAKADFDALKQNENDKIWRAEVARRLDDVSQSPPLPQTEAERIADIERAMSDPDLQRRKAAVFSYEALSDQARETARTYLASSSAEAVTALARLDSIARLAIDARNDPALESFVKRLRNLPEQERGYELHLLELYQEGKDNYKAKHYARAREIYDSLRAQCDLRDNQFLGALAGELVSRCEYYLELYQDSIKTLEPYTRIYQKLGWTCENARVLSNLALSTTRLGRHSVAIDYGVQSLQAVRNTNEPEGKYLQFLGLAYWNLGDLQKALDYLRNSTLALRRGFALIDDMAYNYLNLADIYGRTDRHRLALMCAQQALSLAPDANRSAQAASFVGLELANGRQFDAADEKIREAIDFVEKIQGSRSHTEALVLTRAGQAAFMSGDANKALEYFTRAEAVAANEGDLLLQRLDALSGAGEAYAITGDSARADASFGRAIDLIDAQDKSLTERWQRLAFLDQAQAAIDRKFAFVMNRASGESDAFALLEHSRARVLANELVPNSTPASPSDLISEVQRALPADTLLISYAVTDERTYILVLGRNGLTAKVSPATSGQLTRLVGDYVSGIVDKAALEELSTRARQLSDLLIAPIDPLIAGAKTLCIIPDKALHRLPFAALEDSSNRYLVESRSIMYAPSASVLVKCLKQASARSNDPEAMLAVGNPTFDRDRFHLPDLIDAETEATQCARLYDRRTVLLERTATEAAVRNALSEATVAHLALHCLVNPQSPQIASLLLASNRKGGKSRDDAGDLSDQTDDTDDGVLNLTEVYQLSLPRTKLVILSACETGVGQYYRGEGMVSLIHPFLAAKVSTVVASLWGVESGATRELMIEFHRSRTSAALRSADALRDAQLTLLGNQARAHPYYWASFSVVGGNY